MNQPKTATIEITLPAELSNRLANGILYFASKGPDQPLTPELLSAAYVALDNLLNTLPHADIQLPDNYVRPPLKLHRD